MALTAFAAALAIRLAANLALALMHGQFASDSAEIWFYLGVAEHADPGVYGLSAWDPTVWILRPLGLLFGGEALYAALLFAGSVAMAAASAALALAARSLAGGRGAPGSTTAGLAAGLLYAVLPAAYGASLGGFTHDTIGLPTCAAALGVLAMTGEPGVRDASRPRRRAWWMWLGLAALIACGLRVGPSALVVLVAAAITLAARACATALGTPRAAVLVGGAFLLAAVVLITQAASHPGAPGTWVAWVWQRLAAAARGERGLDIVLQSRQGSVDVLPGRPWELLASYPGAVVVTSLAGVLFAWRRGRIEPLVLAGLGVLGFCIAQRGARVVELAVALGVGLAIGDAEGQAWLGRALGLRQSRPRAGAVILALLAAAGTLLLAAVARRPADVYAAASAGALASGLALSAAIAVAALPAAAWRLAALAFVAIAQALPAQHAYAGALTVGDAQVSVLRAVRALPGAAPDDAILPAAWDLGYLAGMASGRPPAAHPQAIHAAGPNEPGENDARIFWSPEAAAAAEARRRHIRFVFIGERDFKILEEFPAEDRFRTQRRLAFQVPTLSSGGRSGPMPLSIVRHLLAYRMLHDATGLESWRLVAEARSPGSGELVRTFEVTAPPDSARTSVFAVLDNPSPDAIEAEVELTFEPAGGGEPRRGGRQRMSVLPNQSGLATFSFAGVVAGVGRARVSNPALEVRLVSRESGGRYAVDYVRPRDGWAPLELR
jgi:hypothetical protein